MKCNQCGMDNNALDARHCSNCGALLTAPGNMGGQNPAPQQQYQPPQQYYPPQPMTTPRVETKKNAGMTETLFLISGILLVLAGFGNLDSLQYSNIGAQYPILGIFALLAGLFVLAIVIMPNMIKIQSNMLGMIMLGISILFFFWGLAALYGNNIGWYGAEIAAAGFAGLIGSALKMGFIK